MNGPNMLDFFYPGKPFQPSVIQQSCLLAQFVSYEENEVLSVESHSQHFIFFVSYEWDQYARVFVLASLSSLVWCITLAYRAIL
jgi:hypothetical protein